MTRLVGGPLDGQERKLEHLAHLPVVRLAESPRLRAPATVELYELRDRWSNVRHYVRSEPYARPCGAP